MQSYWLNKKNNKDLIVFFNGWAMNESPIIHLEKESFDILVVHDYRNFDFDFSKYDFTEYEKKYLICWSMGVFAVNKFYDVFENFDYKIAINGTTSLISDEFGIPEKIFKITAKFLNEESLDKFIKNMFKGGVVNPEITITRSLNEIKDELIEIQKISFKNEIEFNKAIISNDDRIIPTKNQINFWNKKTKIEIINATHCPFKNYSSWRELLCLTKN